MVHRQLELVKKLKDSGAVLHDRSYEYPGPDSFWAALGKFSSFDPAFLGRYLGQWACLEINSEVYLSDMNVDNETIEEVASLSNLNGLIVVGDRNVTFAPSMLKRFTRLRSLSLVGNWVTNQHLQAIAELPNLESLNLVNTSLTNEDQIELKRILPKTEVFIGSTESLMDTPQIIDTFVPEVPNY
jgi:hypothetical protein